MIIDLTGIVAAIVGGIFSMLAIMITAQIDKRSKDKQAASTLDAAIENALGAIQQAAVNAIKSIKPAVHIDRVPDSLAAGVQYVLDHAGDEMERFGLTPELIADKINARIGLKSLAFAHAQAIQTTTMPPLVAPVLMPQARPSVATQR